MAPSIDEITDRFPGAEWWPIPGCPGLPWGSGAPARKIVGHSTEGYTIAGAAAAYTANRSPAHLTVDPLLETIAQHVTLRRAAYSLRNGPDEIETNRDPYVWQVEIVGRAAYMDEMPASACRWLGRAVFGPLCEITGTPAIIEPTHAYPPEDGHLLGREPWRYSITRWDTYSGICWHQNVPDTNTHGDPGLLDVEQLAAGIHERDDDMTPEQARKLDEIHAALIGPGNPPKPGALRRTLQLVDRRTFDLVSGNRPTRAARALRRASKHEPADPQ